MDISVRILTFPARIEKNHKNERRLWNVIDFVNLLASRFYDLNGDGCISKHEMMTAIFAIYEMVNNEQTVWSMVNRHVDRLFEKMDTDKDGMISIEEFIASCKNVQAY